MTTHDDTVAVLHGSADNSLRWIWLSPKHGRETVALLDRRGFWIRDHFGAPGISEIAEHLPRLWSYRLADVDLSGHATHRLTPPQMQDIEPLPD